MSKNIRKIKRAKKRSGAHYLRKSNNDAPQNISLTMEQTYQLALQNFQAGNLQQAENLCKQLLNVDPDNEQGNHLLGVVAQQDGRISIAVQLIKKAIQANPNNANAFNNLGLALKKLNKRDEAITAYKKALLLNPNYVEVYNNLGDILLGSGRINDAIISFKKVLTINPKYAKAHINLGLAFKKSNKLEEAIASYKKALSLNPNYVEAYSNLGNAFLESGRMEEAISSYRKALSINPEYITAYNNLGSALHKSGKLDEAITIFEKALALNPNHVEAHNNLGVVFQESGRQDEAIASYRKALAINPNHVEAQNNLGGVLQVSGKTEEAIACYRKALSLNPDYAEGHCHLGVALQKLGKVSEAIVSYRKALAINPDYAEAYNYLGCGIQKSGNVEEAIVSYRKAVSLKADYFFAHSDLLFAMNYCSGISQKEIFHEALIFAEKFSINENCCEYFPSRRDTIKRKLKVGYVSPDFRRHSVSFFVDPLLKAHNRERFDIYCYSDVLHPDMITRRLEKSADHWITIAGKNNEDVMDRIKSDAIDILVDLAGHTGQNRLSMFAQKAAPIQVSWLGYPNTTGLKEIDYRFTDAIADPLDQDQYYSEELIRLKGGFLSYQAYDHAPDVSASPCLGSGTITFGCFNNLAKVTPEVVKVWAKILLKVPDSKIVLKAKSLLDESIGMRYLEMFDKEGILPDRIELLKEVPDIIDHLATYNKVDIALDPFPYNGTTTTLEAMWMGVPVVVLLGDRHAARVGASILHKIGMDDFGVAESIDSYIEKAIGLANDKNELTKVRNNLRQQMKDSPLCDAESFVKNVEEAYLNMWKKYTGNYVKED